MKPQRYTDIELRKKFVDDQENRVKDISEGTIGLSVILVGAVIAIFFFIYTLVFYKMDVFRYISLIGMIVFSLIIIILCTLGIESSYTKKAKIIRLIQLNE